MPRQSQIVEVYNRLPWKLEFQCDGFPMEIEPHAKVALTIGEAQCAIRQSFYKLEENDWVSGVVPWNHPDFEKPLTKEDIYTGDPILDNEIAFPNDGYVREMVKIPRVRELMPGRRRSVNPDILMLSGKGG